MLRASVTGIMARGGASLGEKTLWTLALEAFRHTAHYDTAISTYLAVIGREPGLHPDVLILELQKKQELRYGENPHQGAAFYVERNIQEPCVSRARQIAGPELSFNNILDLNAALELVKEFDRPAAAVIKHNNPCGAGVADSIHEAYIKAYLGDPVSAFGGVLALNRPFDLYVAKAVAEVRAEIEGKPAPYFLEAIIAPRYEQDALKLLYDETNWGVRARLLECSELSVCATDESARDMRRFVGGMLVQDRDLLGFPESSLSTVTETAPTAAQMADLKLAWLCCKHVKSNAIVLAKDGMVVGVGAGQIEAHFLSVGEDQLTLARAIGQRGNQRTGIDRIPLLRLRREDRGHAQKLRKGRDQKIGRTSHKNQLVTGLSMRVQLRATLLG
jgi:phosphoribosylaminoimidazolecarboxamide formyltransferase/IMP cyclohydrolase